MKIQCPKCGQAVPPGQVNMSTDLALCPECNEGFKISESVDLDSASADVLRNPPKGAWFRKGMDGAVVGASTRSPMAFFLIPFMCVWSGLSLGGIYGRQIMSGHFDLMQSLFGIPFALGTVALLAFTLMAIGGKVEVTTGKAGAIFVGLGSLGWTRRFDWASVKTIREEATLVQYPGGQQGAIVLEGKDRIKFGTGLNEKRRYFVLNALKHLRAEAR